MTLQLCPQFRMECRPRVLGPRTIRCGIENFAYSNYSGFVIQDQNYMKARTG